MSTSKRNYVIIVLLLVMVFVSSWFWEMEVKMPRIGFEFEPGNSNITPTFLQITQGSLMTNFVNTPLGKKPKDVYYGHTISFYDGTLKPEPYPRYIFKKTFFSDQWPRSLIRPSETIVATPENVSVLWLGYTGTKSIIGNNTLVLISSSGEQIPLLPHLGSTLPKRKEVMDSFALPILLTNKGEYSLVLTNSNKKVLSFEIR